MYACCPSEPWPGIIYTISLSRVQMFYNTVIIAPTIIITMLSFAVFFLPSNTIDALSYGITIIVVVILMQVVMIDMLPVCEEPLWINSFVLSNTGFCMLALIQSCVTIIIENLEAENLIPLVVYDWLGTHYVACTRAMRRVRRAVPGGGAGAGPKSSESVTSPEARVSSVSRKEIRNLAKSTRALESIAGIFYRSMGAGETEEEKSSFKAQRRGIAFDLPETPPGGDGSLDPSMRAGALSKSPSFLNRQPSVRPTLRTSSQDLTEEDRLRLTYFENLFFKLDIDRSGTLEHEECSLLLSFAALDSACRPRRPCRPCACVPPVPPVLRARARVCAPA